MKKHYSFKDRAYIAAVFYLLLFKLPLTLLFCFYSKFPFSNRTRIIDKLMEFLARDEHYQIKCWIRALKRQIAKVNKFLR